MSEPLITLILMIFADCFYCVRHSELVSESPVVTVETLKQVQGDGLLVETPLMASLQSKPQFYKYKNHKNSNSDNHNVNIV